MWRYYHKNANVGENPPLPRLRRARMVSPLQCGCKIKILMKNYSSNKAQRGKTAYRKPSRFIYQKYVSAQIFKNQTNRNTHKTYGTKKP